MSNIRVIESFLLDIGKKADFCPSKFIIAKGNEAAVLNVFVKKGLVIKLSPKLNVYALKDRMINIIKSIESSTSENI